MSLRVGWLDGALRVISASFNCNRSGSQNLALAITTLYGVPCRHEPASRILPGTLGTAPTRSPRLHRGMGRASSLYSGSQLDGLHISTMGKPSSGILRRHQDKS